MPLAVALCSVRATVHLVICRCSGRNVIYLPCSKAMHRSTFNTFHARRTHNEVCFRLTRSRPSQLLLVLRNLFASLLDCTFRFRALLRSLRAASPPARCLVSRGLKTASLFYCCPYTYTNSCQKWCSSLSHFDAARERRRLLSPCRSSLDCGPCLLCMGICAKVLHVD